MMITAALSVCFITGSLCALFEPEFNYEDLDYYEYKEYVSNGWLDPNFFVEKKVQSTAENFLDGYKLIDERLLIPNVRIGYLPIKEIPVRDYEIMKQK